MARGRAVQEIFGINDNMRGLAGQVAAEGYVALVPGRFWRIERRFERKDESGMGDALGLVRRFDRDAPSFDDRAAAEAAWPRTLDFLARHLTAG
ncbi:MAG TPA: dienelactone hydrolase family protein [Acidimicrobiia bacterium]|nr:dienelactone hydrolase family protein [Acidimicrobiia bacterium]